ncbi:hypothetical protein [Gordonia sp. MP11Mi]|uniref:Uncharacterized protein n=1 Tax=Gordonia sp. MP11Mi TaxID=3022769 RepID=A0AA97GVC4_9ACTN
MTDEIVLYCAACRGRGEQGHVERFRKRGGKTWTVVGGHRPGVSEWVQLSGDDLAGLEQYLANGHQSPGGRQRDRYRFECPRCGDTLPVRWGRVRLVLALIAGQGATEISIDSLRRAVAKVVDFER